MPILIKQDADFQDLLELSWATERQVVTVGGEASTEGWELGFHCHTKPQLLLVLSGVVTCEVEAGIWLVPPGSALFIASGMSHRLAIAGEVKSYVTLISAAAALLLPSEACTISVSPLLRALVQKSAEFLIDGEENPTQGHVTALLLSELAEADTTDLHLPMPSNPRLRTIFTGIMANPAERGTIEFWARQAGLSQRTLERLITLETGLSFGRRRQQLNILLALRWMAEGSTIQQVASDLGYESVGSFVTMFRKIFGSTPGRCRAEHLSRQRLKSVPR